MTITVFDGSGAIGQFVIKQALGKGLLLKLIFGIRLK